VIYDAVIVGGGLGGSTLAKNLQEHGLRVLLLEREIRFKDRVRGEQMHPWGVSAAKSLGIYDDLLATCGNQTRWWTTWIGGQPVFNRDLQETTPHGVGSFNVYHPVMQETLLRMAETAGTEVWRGATVEAVLPGSPPQVLVRAGGSTKTLQARVVVGADGRNSQVRSWASLPVSRDPDRLVIAGLLCEGVPAPENATHHGVGGEGATLVAPLGQQRARVYFMYRKDGGARGLAGERRVGDFLSFCGTSGVPGEWCAVAKAAGPLAEFNGADHWVGHPARDGVVLIGDAAAATDPDWGTGLSLTLLDVLTLRDCLLSNSDWEVAIHQYAVGHDRYHKSLHDLTQAFAELLWTPGHEADARRNRVLPRLLTDPRGLPDLIGLGPESRMDDEAQRLLFGETQPAEA
jgi:2-polyprenyl-6-methoxyphenol hydroxylase-like FAD-dependent oxidoreductase